MVVSISSANEPCQSVDRCSAVRKPVTPKGRSGASISVRICSLVKLSRSKVEAGEACDRVIDLGAGMGAGRF